MVDGHNLKIKNPIKAALIAYISNCIGMENTLTTFGNKVYK